LKSPHFEQTYFFSLFLKFLIIKPCLFIFSKNIEKIKNSQNLANKTITEIWIPVLLCTPTSQLPTHPSAKLGGRDVDVDGGVSLLRKIEKIFSLEAFCLPLLKFSTL
jgi:hypothetical protein